MMPSLTLAMAAIALSSTALLDEAADRKAARDAHNNQVLMQHYPPRALAAREQGVVEFALEIDKSGEPTSCMVTGSSGYPLLDKETCDLMLRNGSFERPKDANGRFVTQRTVGAIVWRHPDMEPPANKVRSVNLRTANAQRKICKTETEAGSIARRLRVCMTREEWDRQVEDMKKPWEEMLTHKWTAGS